MGRKSKAQDELSVASLYQDAAVAAAYIDTRFSLSWGRLLHQSQVAALNRVIRKYQPATILEIAPGPARIAADLRGVRQGLMIEYSEAMLALAKQRLASAGLASVWQLLHYNAFDLAALQCQCDLLYAFRFIRHFNMEERARLYRGIHACLKPGGLFMLDVVNRHVRDRLDAQRPSSCSDALEVYDVTYSPEEFRCEMETYGFAVISMQPVIRYFDIQSWISYTFNRRAANFATLVVNTIEQFPSKSPLEWIALLYKQNT
jgi:SAM-dependent methyltransferase